MLKIVIPVSAILTIIALVGIFSFMGDLNQEVKEKDLEGIAEVTTEYAVEEIEKETKNAVFAPFIPYIVGGIVVIGKLFGIKLIFS